MRDCPDAVTWQALLDGEEKGPALQMHLERCEACRVLYSEIAAASDLADGLFTEAALAPDFTARVLRRAKPFPAGLVAALLFALLAASAAWSDPGGLHWWLTEGMTRQIGFVLDTAFSVFYMLHGAGPAWLFTAAAALVALEILLLHKIKTTEE